MIRDELDALTRVIHKPSCDSIEAWLAAHTEEEIAEILMATLDEEQMEEFNEALDALIAAHQEH